MDLIPSSQNRFSPIDDLFEDHATHSTRNSISSKDTKVVATFTNRISCETIVQHVNMRRAVIIVEDEPISWVLATRKILSGADRL